MPPSPARAGRVIAWGALGVSPLVVHGILLTGRWLDVAAGITVLQVTALAWAATGRLRPSFRLALASSLAVLLALLFWRFRLQGVVMSFGLPHALIYLTLLTIFGSSLRAGRQPVITSVAQRVRGPLNAELLAYTRLVTWIWCLFCAGQLLGSLMLLLFAPVAVWSFFVNVLNVPLVLLLFGAEYGYRNLRYRRHPRERFSDLLRVFRSARGAAAEHAD